MSREEWLKELCPEIADWQVEAIAEAMDNSVAAEREACAQVCDAAIPYIRIVPGEEMYYSGINVCTNLAAEIRARGRHEQDI